MIHNDRLRFAERVGADWRALGDAERALVRNALATIADDPIIGAPLLEPLRGYWSHRVDALRIIYRIVAEARFILIVSISK
jgi:mRNA-degrading endonuclease RelE of RelBE toxin-antitoxin system